MELTITISLILIFVIFYYFNRKINRFYIKKSAAADFVNKSSLLVLPDLRNHRFFNEASRQMRIAESSSNKLEKILTVWTIRGYRNMLSSIMHDIYEEPDKFDMIGNPNKFRSSMGSSLVTVSSTIRHKLIDEFSFPVSVYAKWEKHKEWFDELMSNSLSITSEKLTTYDRLQCTMDFQFIRMAMMRKLINDFMISGEISATEIAMYNPPADAEIGTTVPDTALYHIIK